MSERHLTESFQERNKFINSRTPTKKVWEKFRKLNRNYKPRIVPPLDRGINIITLPDEITDTFADHYAKILIDLHKKGKPGKNRNKKREEELPNKKPFTDRELKAAINQQKNTTPGEDTIHLQMLKKISPETLK